MSIVMSIADIRTDYRQRSLSEQDIATDPITQFLAWFDEALTAEVLEVNAMCLATASADGTPSARMVLLKGADAQGFVFYTDFRSRKGRELTENPRASLCFYWGELERQVRIAGTVQRVSRVESDEYFQSRPHESRIGAWTSVQSSVLPSRATLEAEMDANIRRFTDAHVPLPEHWGGFRVVPEEVEFWQGRPSRLHDRIQYRREANRWVVRRLSP